MKLLINMLLVAACLAAGLLLGPHLRNAYDELFPAAPYETGNYVDVHQGAGKAIVMFSTSTCQHCENAREFLFSRHVDFVDFVIDKSPDAQRRFEALGGGKVPQLFIGQRRITGFREDIILESLVVAGQISPTDANSE